MRTCPICHTAVFDDMDTCYGCMHRFEEEEGRCDADAMEAALGTEPGAAGAQRKEDAALKAPVGGAGGADDLLGQFLVGFERFLRGFLVERDVQV